VPVHVHLTRRHRHRESSAGPLGITAYVVFCLVALWLAITHWVVALALILTAITLAVRHRRRA
jgi:uncharacterized membrane protein YccF (DUF307 family)